MSCSFYCLDSETAETHCLTLGNQYTYTIWHPSPGKVVPHGVPLFPFGVWWLMHYLHLFRNRDYGIFVVYNGDRVVHRSGIFPGYFRFPFMRENDLQIGDVWTDPEHRGKGMAASAVQQILQECRKPGRRFWYITEESNLFSVRIVQRAGFTKVGKGRRRARLGLRVLGLYEIQADEKQ